MTISLAWVLLCNMCAEEVVEKTTMEQTLDSKHQPFAEELNKGWLVLRPDGIAFCPSCCGDVTGMTPEEVEAHAKVLREKIDEG